MNRLWSIFIYDIGINIFKSANGGTSWTPSASWRSEGGTDYVHADIHYFGRNPINNEIWVGSDGGVDFSPATAGSINHMDIFSTKLIKEKI